MTVLLRKLILKKVFCFIDKLRFCLTICKFVVKSTLNFKGKFKKIKSVIIYSVICTIGFIQKPVISLGNWILLVCVCVVRVHWGDIDWVHACQVAAPFLASPFITVIVILSCRFHFICVMHLSQCWNTSLPQFIFQMRTCLCLFCSQTCYFRL